MKMKWIRLILLAPLLVACDRETGPGPEIHDSKYRALGADGQPLDALPARWDCVLDVYTGLTWEVKTETTGLHDWRNTYSWYDPGESHDGELDYRGTENGGECAGSACDTHALVKAVNEAGYCGYHDWRLPARDELASINDPRRNSDPPTTNQQYFPFAQADEYWSSNDYSFQWNAAWLWNFHYGHDRVEWKATPRMARLVRGESEKLQPVKD